MPTTRTDRVALVTGANRGMGRETARQLFAAGMRVVLTGRDLDATERGRREIDHAASRTLAVAMDVTDPQSIGRALKAAVDAFGAVDVLVNNAAILAHEDDDVLDIPLEAYRETFDANLFGAIETCRVFVPPMAARGYGRVVNVSSGAGQLSEMSTYAPAYSISKAALNAFTRIVAATYRHRGVLANAVDPGWVRTDMGGKSAPRSVEQGVQTTLWLTMLPDDGPTGGFFRDRRSIAW